VVNEDKTAIMRPRGRQTVTGLVVNARNSRDGQGAPRVSRRDIRRFRAFLHQYETSGPRSHDRKMGQDSLAYARGTSRSFTWCRPNRNRKFALHTRGCSVRSVAEYLNRYCSLV
jgi:hypothetical protein